MQCQMEVWTKLEAWLFNVREGEGDLKEGSLWSVCGIGWRRWQKGQLLNLQFYALVCIRGAIEDWHDGGITIIIGVDLRAGMSR